MQCTVSWVVSFWLACLLLDVEVTSTCIFCFQLSNKRSSFIHQMVAKMVYLAYTLIREILFNNSCIVLS